MSLGNPTNDGTPVVVHTYQYTDKQGKQVVVKRHTRKHNHGIGAHVHIKIDSPLRAVVPTPKRVLGRVSTKRTALRLTHKHGAKNIAKRARKQIRKAVPGARLFKVKR